MSHQVFICHASEDKTIADAVCAFLEQERIPSWIAPRDILPADDYGKAIVEAITSSRLVVLVFSSSANASPHIRRELELAVSHGIPILPFRVEDEVPSESLQYYLGGIHWLDALTPPLEEHLRHLAGTVRVILDRNEPPLRGNRAAAAGAAGAAAGAGVAAAGIAAEPAPGPTAPSPPPTAGTPTGAGAPPPAAPPPPGGTPYGPGAPPPGAPTPSGRTSIVKWVLIGVGALVLIVAAGIALALALAGGGAAPDEAGGGTEATTDAGSDEGTETDDPATLDDAEQEELMALSEQSCELLDPADVAAVFGAEADPGTPAGDGYCDFAEFQSITVWEEDADETDLAFWRDATDPEGLVDLPDLGGGAFQEPNGTLTVLDPNRGIIFLMITGGSTPEDSQRLVDLAELILADG